MNSTERLLACLHGEVPDRVPISTYELAGYNPDNFENKDPSYAELMAFIREHADCIYMTGVGVPNTRSDACSWETLEQYDDGDQHVTRRVLHAPGGDLTLTTSRSDDVMTTWTREHLCKNLDDLQVYLDIPWEPGEADFSQLNVAWQRLEGRHGLPMLDMGDPLCEVAAMFSMEDFVVLAMTETDAFVAAMDRLHEKYVEVLRRTLAGPVKNCLFRIYGPEYATPPFLPPELFAKFVTRYDRVYCRMMREAGVFPRIHSHGKIGRVVEEIRKIDPVAIDPVEPPPDGDITIAQLKRQLPELVLCGGLELKHIEAADATFIDALVRDLIAQGKPGGRYIILPTAAPINIPLRQKTAANYRQFIETALEAGRY
ncbi:MAG: hypothetical protein FWE88_01735 [Phycisphaerae bacterium]|nr:hypothetical protein [Phycisphaerae bacterium]